MPTYGSIERRGLRTSMWLANAYGGLTAATAKQLLARDTIAKELPTKGGIDGTVYGRGATATGSYLCHHMRRMSNAIVTADAESIAAEADKRIRIAEPLGDLPTTAADAGC